MRLDERKLINHLFGPDLRYPDYVHGLTALIWGLWLMNPYVDTFASNSGFRVMAGLAPEMVWGIVLVAISLSRLFGIKNRRARRTSTLILSLYWLVVAMSVGPANPSGTGWIAYAGYSALNAFTFLRLSSD